MRRVIQVLLVLLVLLVLAGENASMKGDTGAQGETGPL
jgi:hypothetical protein